MSKSKKRNVFGELMEGVQARRAHREGRISLRSHHVPVLSLPRVDQRLTRSTRERLHLSRAAFARPTRRQSSNPRTVGTGAQQAD